MKVDCIVAGAGVVGLAVARALALRGAEVIVLESQESIGTQASSRNSEVIHAGIYYPTASMKARMCIAGRDALYRYCEERGVSHRRTGKLIVATDPGQLAKLATIRQQALRNGVTDLAVLTREEVAQVEPQLSCIAALMSPTTGIVDSHQLMVSLRGDAEHCGAWIVLNTPVGSVLLEDRGIVIRTGGADPMSVVADVFVNSAGLAATDLAKRIRGFPSRCVPTQYYAKGSYFGLSGVRAPFRRLVYPLPDEAGLGVHVTIDLAGRVRFGPDVEWVDEIEYEVDARRADSFYTAVRKYWPALPDGALVPAYAGVRTKIASPTSAAADFLIQDAPMHGVPGLVNLFGIESPGLTSCLAIADCVAELATNRATTSAFAQLPPDVPPSSVAG